MECKKQNEENLNLYTVTTHLPLTGPFGGPYDKLADDAYVEAVGDDGVPHRFNAFEEDEPLFDGRRNRYTLAGVYLTRIEFERLEHLDLDQTVPARTPEEAASRILRRIFGRGTAWRKEATA